MAKQLSITDQERLISDLQVYSEEDQLSVRRNELNNKQGYCPYCNSRKYVRFGLDKGSQRFKCKDCQHTFTEYTGTWVDGLHKKDIITDYIELMIKGKSLDKTSAALHINKKTAFDWRHKVLSSLEQDSGDKFDDIVESDETFFPESEKGNKSLNRPGRKRGKSTDRKSTRLNSSH